ncbi:hypothetical protein KEM56_006555 [Ascosphaera pollenicola]|nr:hypothetical protein KEM56_006555 [Ascosphaera pollenicola]
MASFTRPVFSSIGEVDFGFMSDEEIKRVSVKRIYNTPTLDSFNNPVPGGLYDPALGAWGDHIGHCGHIELPVHLYNVTFFDQLYRLLRAQCIYCHRFRLSRAALNAYVCKLSLLKYGLVNDVPTIDDLAEHKGKQSAQSDSDSSEDEDVDDLIKRRNSFVRKCIKKALAENNEGSLLANAKNPVAAERRRNIVREFFKTVVAVKKCAHCSGISPQYRRDRYSKVFKKALPAKAKAAMREAGFRVPNPLVLLREANEVRKKHDKDGVHQITFQHGAEEQIAFGNAALAETDDSQNTSDDGQQQYIPSSEVYASMRLLFEKELEILDLVYDSRPRTKGQRSRVSAEMFFTKNILVPSNKYRPVAMQGPGDVLEAQQNTSFNRILKLCDLVNQISSERQKGEATNSAFRLRDYRDLLQAIVQLQDAVNSLIDRDRNPNQGAAGAQNEDGIKQKLEKKEGLFRKNMMGKRVNFAARSVISPDPNIETNEIGIPLVFAKKLTYPEPVTDHNYYKLKQAVINGPDIYPGASAVENELGQVINLKFKTADERVAIANMLLSPSTWKMKRSRNKKVYRHLATGDVVLMNRQPTLHKPSIMGHRARVLMGERTIRMHYANTNTYNADFDGDEMNLHFPQNELARSEAMQLADTDHQYLSATAGKPLRGLIQDHISMGVWITSRDTFFDEEDYQNLLYSCLRPENNHTVTDRIELMPPTVWKPQKLWTGKQVISTILKNVKPPGRAGLNLTGKSSTPGNRWGKGSEEGAVIFKDGELLCGILDKAQLGPAAGGLFHSVHEIYGHIITGKLIGIMGRLLTKFLNMRAFTCGMDDLRLTPSGNEARKQKLSKADEIGQQIALKYVTLDENPVEDQEAELKRRLEDALRDDEKQGGLDSVYNSRSAELSSDITATCLPAGLEKPFPRNQMQSMTVSGAKGSAVNANLISCNLGQQVLEGRRVPIMVSGKSLPSFRPYDTSLSAGGYVCGRFLTGIKPQEYFFHTMAGREGLIDTAVKTSRSGYLQRCVIKGMEGLKAEYDSSVRDTADGSIVQFLYGEDGLEITKQKHLKDFKFLAQNYESIVNQVDGAGELARMHVGPADDHNQKVIKKIKKDPYTTLDPALSLYAPGANLGSTSESFAAALKKYEKENPDKLLKDKQLNPDSIITKKNFHTVLNMKYLQAVIDPGEAVGIVAGQSIGEPSTQMTLNTFHLAGHSAKNVTLGIPRLREIVMTASTSILTPTMSVQLNKSLGPEGGKRFAKGISKLSLAEIIDRLEVHERIIGTGNNRYKVYDIEIIFYPPEEYSEEYAIRIQDVGRTLEESFVKELTKLTRKELSKRQNEKKGTAPSAAQPEVGVSSGVVEEAPRQTFNRNDEEHEDDDEDDEEDAKRANALANRSNQVSYAAPDEAEEAIMHENSSDSEDEDEEESSEDTEMKDADGAASDGELRERKREKTVTRKHPEVARFKFSAKKGDSCSIQLQYDISTPKLLLLPIVEDAARKTLIQFIPGLGTATYIDAEGDEPASIITDGINLMAMRDFQDYILPQTLYTNSIYHMLTCYGVEAARASIVREMSAVFEGHSISVDNRHLNLIGDVMTHSGGYQPFNRIGLVKEGSSPFMKMSFETTVGFLRDAVLERDWDNLKNPSSRIVMGQPNSLGTGCFDVLAPVA